MALYEYRCAKGHATEVFHPISETPAVRCELCGAPAERVLSPPMIHTQYHFSPQVHGARKPRHRPAVDAAPAPAADPAPEDGERHRDGHDGAPKAAS